jgi:hypothetical protein
MLNTYKNYIKENKTNYQVICEINENYLKEISGQNNINIALQNELNFINTLNLEKIEKLENNIYKLIIKPEDNILEITNTNDIETAIKKEFGWLNQSGIQIKNILPL